MKSMPIDVTDDLISAVDWPEVVKTVTWKVLTYRANPTSGEPIIYIPFFLRDIFLDGWASAYLCDGFPVSHEDEDDLRIRVVRRIAKSLGVNITINKPHKFLASQESLQSLRYEMEKKGKLIVSGVWVTIATGFPSASVPTVVPTHPDIESSDELTLKRNDIRLNDGLILRYDGEG